MADMEALATELEGLKALEASLTQTEYNRLKAALVNKHVERIQQQPRRQPPLMQMRKRRRVEGPAATERDPVEQATVAEHRAARQPSSAFVRVSWQQSKWHQRTPASRPSRSRTCD